MVMVRVQGRPTFHIPVLNQYGSLDLIGTASSSKNGELETPKIPIFDMEGSLTMGQNVTTWE